VLIHRTNLRCVYSSHRHYDTVRVGSPSFRDGQGSGGRFRGWSPCRPRQILPRPSTCSRASRSFAFRTHVWVLRLRGGESEHRQRCNSSSQHQRASADGYGLLLPPVCCDLVERGSRVVLCLFWPLSVEWFCTDLVVGHAAPMYVKVVLSDCAWGVPSLLISGLVGSVCNRFWEQTCSLP
jgi:hypothetical protein